MRFLVFLHTIHKTVIVCWLPSHMGISGNERADSAAKAALQKDVSDCLISYTDAYQYISQYVRDSYLTHSYLLKGDPPPECVTCDCRLTISHILVDCIEYDFFHIDFV